MHNSDNEKPVIALHCWLLKVVKDIIGQYVCVPERHHRPVPERHRSSVFSMCQKGTSIYVPTILKQDFSAQRDNPDRVSLTTGVFPDRDHCVTIVSCNSRSTVFIKARYTLYMYKIQTSPPPSPPVPVLLQYQPQPPLWCLWSDALLPGPRTAVCAVLNPRSTPMVWLDWRNITNIIILQ